MEKRGRYCTKQQELVLDCIKQQKGNFYSIGQLMASFQKLDVQIGQTTVYRALERLTADGVVMKIPSVDGRPAQYSYAGSLEDNNYGKLVCMKCGCTILIHCGCTQEFSSHIQEEHHFQLDPQRTILYGYCENCQKNSE